MKIPDWKVNVKSAPNADGFWEIEHDFNHYDFVDPALPAKEPYPTRAEAEAARDRTLEIVRAALSDESDA